MDAERAVVWDSFKEEASKSAEEIHSLRTANAANIAQIDELRHGLKVMSEARLNADRYGDVLRGELQGIREISQREIESMKQMVDCFALQSVGRQVFGLAPLNVRPRDPNAEPPTERKTARQVVSEQTQKFHEQYEAMRAASPPVRTEYSSRFSETDKAVAINGA
jgi:hypothetical protein